MFCFLNQILSIFQNSPNDAACGFPLQFNTTPPAGVSKTPLMLPIHPIHWLFAYSFGCLPSASVFGLRPLLRPSASASAFGLRSASRSAFGLRPRSASRCAPAALYEFTEVNICSKLYSALPTQPDSNLAYPPFHFLLDHIYVYFIFALFFSL